MEAVVQHKEYCLQKQFKPSEPFLSLNRDGNAPETICRCQPRPSCQQALWDNSQVHHVNSWLHILLTRFFIFFLFSFSLIVHSNSHIGHYPSENSGYFWNNNKWKILTLIFQIIGMDILSDYLSTVFLSFCLPLCCIWNHSSGPGNLQPAALDVMWILWLPM